MVVGAKSRLLPRVAGHKEGINSVREITRVCGEIGAKHLTLFTFPKKTGKDQNLKLMH